MADGTSIGDPQSRRHSREPVRVGETPSELEYGEPRGYGWVIFAGVMFMLAGTLDFLYGVAAIANSHFYVGHTHFIVSDLKTWGWVVMLFGVVEFCAALGILLQAAWARWTGVVIASISAIIQLIYLPASPFLALSVFTLDLFVIYGLVTYGGRLEEA